MSQSFDIFFRLIPLGLLLALCACDEDQSAKDKRIYPGPLMEVHNFSMSYSDSGFVLLNMKSAVQFEMQSGDMVYPKQVDMLFFNKQGQETATLRADSGHYFRYKNQYKVMGNVHVLDKLKQQTIDTDELVWDKQTQLITTEKPVVFRKGDEQINGVGLKAKQDFSQYGMSRVNGIVRMNGLPTAQ